MCSLGIEPTTFCAANTMLYHWATGTHSWLSETYHFSSSMKQKKTFGRILKQLVFPYNFIMSYQAPKGKKKMLYMIQNVLCSKSPKAKQYHCVRKIHFYTHTHTHTHTIHSQSTPWNLICTSTYSNWIHWKKRFIEFTKFFKVSGCNQFILATFNKENMLEVSQINLFI